MIKGIPRLYNYVISLSPDFLKNYLSYFESNFDFQIRSNTVAEIKLKNKGGSSDEEWTYNFAEPYPGISIMCGNIKGIEKLNGMTGTDEDMKVSVIHYCRRGRCELHTHDGRFAFSRPGVMCLESRKYKKKDFNFFGEDYNSIEIAFRLDEIDEDSRDYLSGLGIDIAGMQANYEADADFRIGNVSDKLKAAAVFYRIGFKHPDGAVLAAGVHCDNMALRTAVGEQGVQAVFCMGPALVAGE